MDNTPAVFDKDYKGIPAWDIGHPQSAYTNLAQTGQIQGSVLDVGCGTGENALYLAQQGHEVWGIDFSPLAIEKAREKASARGIPATFHVADALDLRKLQKTFDTVIDSGLFHVFSDEERLLFVKSLESVLKPGGTYYLLCFGNQQSWKIPRPRLVSPEEISATFQGKWSVRSIQETRFEITLLPDGFHAWLATITYLAEQE
jgi:cyclopropane fatty-acyl-phospholipid synthase-like methyltransferase